ncbi:hypothetical protein [Halovenus salina]|uniref:Uncharacterized protein n=1 Tax=Halovenus salina TaxID=1510225 RepID=A0ABD5W167_9EURY
MPFEIVSSEPGVDVDTITLAQETDFESDQYGIAVDDQQIETLNENETGYNQVRQDIRTQVRDNLPSSASEDDVDDVLLEANAELKRDARAQVQSQYGEEASDETIDDIVALQNVVIDGLTDPGLTEFDEYTDRRDTAEANLETSLDDELDRGLEEANADMKRQAASDTRDRYAQDASEETVDNIVALQNVVIDGLTDPELTDFDEYTNRRDTAEADLEDAIDQEIADELDRARRNINADLERQIRDEFGSEVSNETIAAIAELQKTLVNGLISPEDDEFGAYETRREQAEGNLEESIASEIRDEIEEQADDQTSLADDFDEDNREISLARTTVELVSFAPLAAAVLAATLIGCVFALTRSARRTASATGFSLLSAGVLGTVTSLLASGPALDATEDAIRSEDASEIETTAIEGLVALIDSVFSTLTTQSLVLLVLGFVLLGVVYADRANYLPLGEE